MEAPESVMMGLRNIRSTFFLRYEPKGKLLSGWSFDVNGNPRRVQYEPRWELWDTDAEGALYKVMTLRGPGDTYLEPGDWLVEFINLINPARYGGSVEKMIEALVDDPNEYASRLEEAEFDALAERLADYFTPRAPLVMVPGLVTV